MRSRAFGAIVPVLLGVAVSLGAAALAGCAGGDMRTAQPMPASAVLDPTGRWVLAAVDGDEVRTPVVLSILAGRMAWEAQCHQAAFAYRLKGSHIRIRAEKSGRAEVSATCANEPTIDSRSLDAFLPLGNTLELGPADALRIYGGGHVLLFARAPS